MDAGFVLPQVPKISWRSLFFFLLVLWLNLLLPDC